MLAIDIYRVLCEAAVRHAITESVGCLDWLGADSSSRSAACSHSQHRAVLCIWEGSYNILCGLGEESQEDPGAHRTGAFDGGVKSLYKLGQPPGKT